MNVKINIYLIFLFFFINGTVYKITQIDTKQRSDLVLKEALNTIETHYEILLHTQKKSADYIYQSTISSPRIIEIISKANSSTKKEKTILRDELQTILTPRYERAKKLGVWHYHFLLPNNEVFLRMHKPSKFGDDLTDIRDDFKYVNETKKPIRGFVQGRVAHGFRNTYPIFDKNHKHIGAMEVSFTSKSFQWYLNNQSHIHTHFLVHKDIFKKEIWNRDDFKINYAQSSENSNYMLALNHIHTKKKCIEQNMKLLESKRDEIDKNVKNGEKFALYIDYNNKVTVVSFLPIKNLKNKTVAWIVSYKISEFLKQTLRDEKILRIISLIASLILIYFIINQRESKQLLKKKHKEVITKHKLLNDILCLTDDIIFITNLVDVKFSNNKFKELFNISCATNFNDIHKHNIFNIFEIKENYIHIGLLKNGENFISLIDRTSEDKRVVSILNKNLESRAFKINIVNSENDGDYIITLSDITKFKELQLKTEKKAYFDNLTKVYNRNKFNEIFERELLRVKRYNNKLSIAIIDIDKFKDFNDSFGHLIGDEVLIMMAQAINKNVRDTDTFARWGGEEFTILFKETDLETATRISKKLKDKIESLNHPIAGKITASFGVTQYKDGDTFETIFERCDKALYVAKENGRNRVESVE